MSAIEQKSDKMISSILHHFRMNQVQVDLKSFVFIWNLDKIILCESISSFELNKCETKCWIKIDVHVKIHLTGSTWILFVRIIVSGIHTKTSFAIIFIFNPDKKCQSPGKLRFLFKRFVSLKRYSANEALSF